MFAPNNLIRVGLNQAVDGGRGTGVDGISLRDITPVELGRIARKLSPCITEGQYVADETRLHRIPKGNGESRPIQIPTGLDKVVAKRLDEIMSPRFEQLFVAQSHGFRPARSNLTLLAALIRALQRQNYCIVAADDMRKAFDSLPIGSVIEAHRRAFKDRQLFPWPNSDDERYLQVIRQVITAGKPNCKRGILQGCPYSPLALNVFLHFHYDTPITKCFSGSWFRYADNIVCAARDPVEGLEFLDKSQERLAKYGVMLHLKDGRIKNLTEKSADVLGFALSRGEAGISLGLARGAWTKLKQKLEQAHRHPNPPLQAVSCLHGWIDAYAPALEPAEPILAHLSLLTERLGFPSVLKPREVQGWIQRSLSRWHTCLAKVMSVV